MSLSHILCGVFGFLLGSAGVAHGSRKRNPVSFAFGLIFLLAGAAALFMAWVDRAIDEAEEEEAEEDEEAAEESEAEAVEKAKEAAETVAEAAEEVAEAVEEAAEAAEDAAKAEDAE